jgi:hypothetical protein
MFAEMHQLPQSKRMLLGASCSAAMKKEGETEDSRHMKEKITRPGIL